MKLWKKVMAPAAMGMLLPAAALHAAADGAKPTFTEDIAPIMFANCTQCHRAGEVAPFELLTFQDAAKRATQIKQVVADKVMPPWQAERGKHKFTTERSLSPEQIKLIGDWADAGAPMGDPAKMPAAPKFVEGWQMGEPDLIVTMTEPYAVPASGRDIYRNFSVPTGLTEDKWIVGYEFRPGDRKVTHHSLFGIASGRGGGMGGGGGALGALGGNFGGWAAGGSPNMLPPGVGVKLDAGSSITFQNHYHPNGKATTDVSRIGLWLTDKPPTRTMVSLGMPVFFGITAGINIAPGDKDFVIKDERTITHDAYVMGVSPHAHYLGKQVVATAYLPDGTSEELLRIEKWNFNWQESYEFDQPVKLPKGTVLKTSFSYDNSAENPFNPTNPPKRVTWGEESTDEMSQITITMMPVDDAEGPAFRDAMSGGGLGGLLGGNRGGRGGAGGGIGALLGGRGGAGGGGLGGLLGGRGGRGGRGGARGGRGAAAPAAEAAPATEAAPAAAPAATGLGNAIERAENQ